MKTRFKSLATILLAALPGGCIPAIAAVPLRWTVETSRATPQRIDIYRGETVTVAADLTSYGRPLALAGEAALYVQTNGMGSAWWTVPATVSSNRIEATLAPSAYPADASLLTCHLGGPALNYRAAFQARILGSPGTAPNTVQPPVATLDFGSLTVLNRPYYTQDETDAGFVGVNGHDMGAGAILGDLSHGYGLGWAGSWHLLRSPGDAWSAETELVRRGDLPDLAPYALMGDAERAGLYSLRTASAYSAASNTVQYVTLPSTASALQISQPPAAAGRVRDWVVYVMAAKDVTVSYDATAHWYSPDAGVAKAVKASTLTAMYFSEIGNNADGKPQFAVSLHELEEVK